MSATAPTVTVPNVAEDVLNSWKEIACYLNRGVRTVQRWESELGLPVRRPRGRSRSAVIAMRSDIDHWLKACPVSAREQMVSEVAVRSANPEDRLVRFQIHAHVERSRWLRNNLHQTRQDFNGALSRLINNLERLAVPQVDSRSRRGPKLT
ncbi:MAG TPA: hypothetical protein VFI72_02290 [Candidatus Angelobacter sp.]|nr:hypothetical protein [Candidatus Angelobacter sp.]